jgi:hypothetical protein
MCEEPKYLYAVGSAEGTEEPAIPSGTRCGETPRGCVAGIIIMAQNGTFSLPRFTSVYFVLLRPESSKPLAKQRK